MKRGSVKGLRMKRRHAKKDAEARKVFSIRPSDPYVKRLQNKIASFNLLKKNLKNNVNICNLKYDIGMINQDQYNLLIGNYLKERTLNEWEEYYDRCVKVLKERIKEYKARALRDQRIAEMKELTQDYPEPPKEGILEAPKEYIPSVVKKTPAFPFDVLRLMKEKTKASKERIVQAYMKRYRKENAEGYFLVQISNDKAEEEELLNSSEFVRFADHLRRNMHERPRQRGRSINLPMLGRMHAKVQKFK